MRPQAAYPGLKLHTLKAMRGMVSRPPHSKRRLTIVQVRDRLRLILTQCQLPRTDISRRWCRTETPPSFSVQRQVASFTVHESVLSATVRMPIRIASDGHTRHERAVPHCATTVSESLIFL